MSYCQLTALGRLGRDPEKSERGPCRFSIATTHTYKPKDGDKVEETEWVNVVVWGPQADVCMRFLSKGRQVLVTGRLKTSEYEGKDGTTKKKTECIADAVKFISDGSKRGGGEAAPSDSAEPSQGAPDDGDDDIPF